MIPDPEKKEMMPCSPPKDGVASNKQILKNFSCVCVCVREKIFCDGRGSRKVKLSDFERPLIPNLASQSGALPGPRLAEQEQNGVASATQG